MPSTFEELCAELGLDPNAMFAIISFGSRSERLQIVQNGAAVTTIIHYGWTFQNGLEFHVYLDGYQHRIQFTGKLFHLFGPGVWGVEYYINGRLGREESDKPAMVYKDRKRLRWYTNGISGCKRAPSIICLRNNRLHVDYGINKPVSEEEFCQQHLAIYLEEYKPMKKADFMKLYNEEYKVFDGLQMDSFKASRSR